jgi:hypothetical protein
MQHVQVAFERCLCVYSFGLGSLLENDVDVYDHTLSMLSNNEGNRRSRTSPVDQGDTALR